MASRTFRSTLLALLPALFINGCVLTFDTEVPEPDDSGFIDDEDTGDTGQNACQPGTSECVGDAQRRVCNASGEFEEPTSCSSGEGCTQEDPQTAVCAALCDDELPPRVYVRDTDEDFYHEPDSETEPRCEPPTDSSNFITRDASAGEDCNDDDASINPGATDIPGNDIDENCDSLLTCFVDNDRDGARAINPGGSPALETTTQPACLTANQHADENAEDDCDDDNPARTPGNDEVCDSVDNDCDNLIDEDTPADFALGESGCTCAGECETGSCETIAGTNYCVGSDPEPACEEYCDVIEENCEDTFSGRTECLRVCNSQVEDLERGLWSDGTDTPTLGCRAQWALRAGTGNEAQQQTFCERADARLGNTCGTFMPLDVCGESLPLSCPAETSCVGAQGYTFCLPKCQDITQDTELEEPEAGSDNACPDLGPPARCEIRTRTEADEGQTRYRDYCGYRCFNPVLAPPNCGSGGLLGGIGGDDSGLSCNPCFGSTTGYCTFDPDPNDNDCD